VRFSLKNGRNYGSGVATIERAVFPPRGEAIVVLFLVGGNLSIKLFLRFSWAPMSISKDPAAGESITSGVARRHKNRGIM
jgi:hypothetical protein